MQWEMDNAFRRSRMRRRQVPRSSDRQTQHKEDVEKLKSQVRSCVMQILTERLSKPADFSETKNVLVTDLILEYLEWMGYNQTLKTFKMECRLPEGKSVEGDGPPQPMICTDGNALPKIFQVMNVFKEIAKKT